MGYGGRYGDGDGVAPPTSGRGDCGGESCACGIPPAAGAAALLLVFVPVSALGLEFGFGGAEGLVFSGLELGWGGCCDAALGLALSGFGGGDCCAAALGVGLPVPESMPLSDSGDGDWPLWDAPVSDSGVLPLPLLLPLPAYGIGVGISVGELVAPEPEVGERREEVQLLVLG